VIYLRKLHGPPIQRRKTSKRGLGMHLPRKRL
jgi:hypothetical protein